MASWQSACMLCKGVVYNVGVHESKHDKTKCCLPIDHACTPERGHLAELHHSLGRSPLGRFCLAFFWESKQQETSFAKNAVICKDVTT